MEIGIHCEEKSCNRLDFLPINCPKCDSKFCSNHINEHPCVLDEGQKGPLKKADPDSLYPCGFKDCTKKELTPVVCGHCQVQLCLGHRNQQDHDCPELNANRLNPEQQMSKTKAFVESVTLTKAANPKKRIKNQKLNAKVQLMKLKQSAKGQSSIPQDEKVYFKVISGQK